MWRETNVAGVLLSPLLVYAGAAVVLWLPLQWAFHHFRLDRWTFDPALAQLALLLALLGFLVAVL